MRWTPLQIEALPSDRWQIVSDFFIDLRPEFDYFLGLVWIPKGFEYDLASVPRKFRGTWFGSRVDTEHAATVHDYGIARGHLLVNSGGYSIEGASITLDKINPKLYPEHYVVTPVTRRQIDTVFRKILIASGVSKFKAWVMWSAVRLAAIF